MKLNIIKTMLLALLMALAGTAATYADETDMGTWQQVSSYDTTTADGYSLWDGRSYMDYELRTEGEQQGIHIYNAAQLARYAWDMYSSSYWKERHTLNVYLECDIDLGGYQFSILRDNYYIENCTFYGQAHVIRNGIAVAKGNRAALFSDIRGATVCDLCVVNYHVVDASVTYAGIICAYMEFTTPNYIIPEEHTNPTICNCRVSGCNISGEITYAGGIVGSGKCPELRDNAVIGCEISTHDDNAGGIIGCCDGSLWKVAAEGSFSRNRVVNSIIYAEDDYAGGILGSSGTADIKYFNHNYVQNCTVRGSGNYIGGAIGYSKVEELHGVYANYIQAKVEPDNGCVAGSFIGYLESHTYSDDNYVDKDYCSLGLYGVQDAGSISATLVGTSQLPRQQFSPYWYVKNTYVHKPSLLPQHADFFSQDITISTADQFMQLAADVNSGRKTYEGRIVSLGADIDLSAVTNFTPIGTEQYPFFGEFNGRGHTISGLTVTASTADGVYKSDGLFGYVQNAYIHNVVLDQPVVKGRWYAAALVGSAWGSCHVSDVWVKDGQVDANYCPGGIVGYSGDHIVAASCYFDGTVNNRNAEDGDVSSGAIVADMYQGTISECGARVTFTRVDAQGAHNAGLVGVMTTARSGSTLALTHCYAVTDDATPAAQPLVGSPVTDGLTVTDCVTVSPSPRDGMKATLGSKWYYYTYSDAYPIPLSLSAHIEDSPVKVVGDFVCMPTDDAVTSYTVAEYNGTATSIIIPDMAGGFPVTHLADNLFSGRTDITSVTLNANITSIGREAFAGCSSLTSIEFLGTDPVEINDYSFANCTALESVCFNCGDFTANLGAFSGCTALTTLRFGANAGFDRVIDMFSGNTAITTFVVDAANTKLKVADGLLQSYDGSRLLMAPTARRGVLTVPEGIKEIGWYAFDDCALLDGIVMPASLTTMEHPAFFGCDGLQFIDLTKCTGLFSDGWFSDSGIHVDRSNGFGSSITNGSPFRGLDRKTMVYMLAEGNGYAHSVEDGEVNVVLGSTATALELTDGYDFVPPTDFTFPSATYDRQLAANVAITPTGETDEKGEPVYTEGYADAGYTVCLPFAAEIQGDETATWKVYAPTKVEDMGGETTVTFTEVVGGQMEAFKPYYLVVSQGAVGIGSTSSENSVAARQTSGTTAIEGASYQLVGTTRTISNADLCNAGRPTYLLQRDGVWHKVPSGVEAAYVGPFRAYFQATSAEAGARRLTMMFGGSADVNPGSDPSAIRQLRTVDADGTERLFDLSGRRIDANAKGIVIRNGKKQIIK